MQCKATKKKRADYTLFYKQRLAEIGEKQANTKQYAEAELIYYY